MNAIASKLKRKLRKSDVRERCGLVLADGKCIDAVNVHGDPKRGFAIPAEMLIAHEDNMVGSWHTHPGQSASYSQEDHAGFSQWPQLVHYIIGTDGVRAYQSVDGAILELDLEAH